MNWLPRIVGQWQYVELLLKEKISTTHRQDKTMKIRFVPTLSLIGGDSQDHDAAIYVTRPNYS